MADREKNGMFLVFEGLDGSGKSTLIQRLQKELGNRHIPCVLTREPGGTTLAEEIRALLLRTDAETPVARTELLLYAASRAQHVAKVIQPALERGEWVICDRYIASSVAFQSFARSLPRADVDWLNSFATEGLRSDLTVLLDLSVGESRRRQRDREQTQAVASDRLEREKESFHEAVRAGYLAQAKENPANWLVLSAEESPEYLEQHLLTHLRGLQWLA